MGNLWDKLNREADKLATKAGQSLRRQAEKSAGQRKAWMEKQKRDLKRQFVKQRAEAKKALKEIGKRKRKR